MICVCVGGGGNGGCEHVGGWVCCVGACGWMDGCVVNRQREQNVLFLTTSLGKVTKASSRNIGKISFLPSAEVFKKENLHVNRSN